MENKPIILIVLDGFGIRKDKKYNSILNTNMKNYFSYWDKYPHTKLHASGPLVGLPDGQIGSSEVGHMTIGAGRLIKQPIIRINEDIKTNNFFYQRKLIDGIKHVKKTKGNVHIMGLLGPGGVHSSSEHLYAFLDFYDMHAHEFEGKVFVHNFLDGRDTPQRSAIDYLKELEHKINSLENKSKIFISTICGRYWAMDRDKRWERTKLAYDMLVFGQAQKSKDYEKSIKKSYENEVYDEFIKPVILYSKPIKNEDLCIFYNFRSDRPRQLIHAFIDNKFDRFERKKFNNLKFQTLTEYYPEEKIDVLYPTIYPKNTLGDIISKNKLQQLRISESEKFPHVTYFFSGLRNEPFRGEEQIKIDSPKVATYDLKPEMSAEEVTNRVIGEIDKDKFDFIMLNFANPDMVGHTGNYNATLGALSKVDESLSRIKKRIDEKNGILLITADHGNCETMRDEKKMPHTKHTYNIVPFVLCKEGYKLNQDFENLSLFNIAPTVLELMNIEKPKEMNESLIEK